MRKLLVSMLTLGLVGVAVFAGTRAFFTDTETSVDNLLQAGAIDLKVDSQGHYNGLECIDEVWTNSCHPEGDNILVNGDFEEPIVTKSQKWDIFPNGTVGWTVAWEPGAATFGGHSRPGTAQLELHRGVNGWLPQNGQQYAELDSDWEGPTSSLNGEPALIRISQNISTTPGKKYLLTYYFSPRPSTGTGENHLTVNVGGTEVGDHTAVGGANTSWTMYSEEFTATGPTTLIEFIGKGTNNSLGVFLDNVSVREEVCDSTFSEYEGRECSSTWEETDLGPTNQFFSFEDLKPGDEGENTVSLHVIDNDAYACMYTENMASTENDVVEPEVEAEDPGQPDGELQKYIYFFSWNDDGDNIWEDGEAPITSEPVLASDFLSQSQGVSLGQIPGGSTKYIGIAWCFGGMNADDETNTITCTGEGDQNDAQTDAIEADIRFYVEQVRNNPNFTCPVPTPD